MLSLRPVSSLTFWSSFCPWAGPWMWDATQDGRATWTPAGPSTPALKAMTCNKQVSKKKVETKCSCRLSSACLEFVVTESLLNFFSYFFRRSCYSRGHWRLCVQRGEEGFVLCRCSDRNSLRGAVFDRKLWSAFAPSDCELMLYIIDLLCEGFWVDGALLLFPRGVLGAQRLHGGGRHQHRTRASFTETTQSHTGAVPQPL